MKAKWDDQEVVLTKRFKDALIELIEAEREMMGAIDGNHLWTWGLAAIGNLSQSEYLSLEFGGDADKPNHMKGTSKIILSE